jgi:hypothetical protein
MELSPVFFRVSRFQFSSLLHSIIVEEAGRPRLSSHASMDGWSFFFPQPRLHTQTDRPQNSVTCLSFQAGGRYQNAICWKIHNLSYALQFRIPIAHCIFYIRTVPNYHSLTWVHEAVKILDSETGHSNIPLYATYTIFSQTKFNLN